MRAWKVLLLFLYSTAFSNVTEIKDIWICDKTSNQTLPFCKVFISSLNLREESNINGKIKLDLMQAGFYQFEYQGYSLLRLTSEELTIRDTVYLHEIGVVDLGTTGIQPYLETDRFIKECECCNQ